MTLTSEPNQTEPLVYDPYDYAMHEDPYPTYARLRSEARCYHNPEREFWALSRHDDVLKAFGDSDRFSNAEGVSIDPAGRGRAARATASFLAMDPPEHGRMRGLVSRGFTPRRVAAMEDHIRAITLEHLVPALEAERFDFVGDLAGLVPMDVVSEMLGVPKADRAELRHKADVVLHRDEGDTDVPPAGIEAALELAVYYQALIEDRKQHPGDDLVSALLTAEIDGDRLSDHEIAGFMFLMVIAGNETTTKLLAHCWYWAALNPGEQAKVLAHIERTPDWVEETLRYDTSSQLLARVTTRDLELFGQHIPAGGRVALLAGSANRDGDFFADPDRYDLDRDTTGIASFGFGRHFCLGASLARLETRVVLEELLKRVSAWDIDEANARRVHSVNVRGFDRLPTTVTLR